ncbi:hypothetical protein K470DRAFT_199781, partial [Piedraia hortae CBS 480.64]
NTLHWSSVKCKRVTSSVVASEAYRMTHGVDIGAPRILTDKLGLPLVVCINSLSLYGCIVKLDTAKEKRLMIDIMSI